jgi:hypothetical protein
MPSLIDLTGQRFTRWTVLRQAASSDSGQGAKWLCRCECGTERLVLSISLRSGSSTSCGCLKVEKQTRRLFRHGFTGTRIHRIWLQMLQRCLNPNHRAYRYYGGRGITICERWKVFENFLADMGEAPAGLSLDRFPNRNGNYEPGNVRWATHTEQMDNTSRNRHYFYKGQRYCISALARFAGIPERTLYHRLVKMQMPVEQAIQREGLK